jgi:hypothetical protein
MSTCMRLCRLGRKRLHVPSFMCARSVLLACGRARCRSFCTHSRSRLQLMAFVSHCPGSPVLLHCRVTVLQFTLSTVVRVCTGRRFGLFANVAYPVRPSIALTSEFATNRPGSILESLLHGGMMQSDCGNKCGARYRTLARSPVDARCWLEKSEMRRRLHCNRS